MKQAFIINMLLISMIFSGVLFAKDVSIVDYGAVSDTTINSQPYIQAAIEACYQTGGGRVIVPQGDFMTGTIELKSHVILYLDAGAVLYASLLPEDYENDFIVYKKNDSGKEGDGATPVLVYAKNAVNTGIHGTGTIHGRARRVFEDLRKTDGFIEKETQNARESGYPMKMYYKVEPFTCMVFLEECRNVSIQDASFIESTDWTLHFKWSKEIYVDNVTIKSSLEKGVNADGIDVDGCRDVVISNCIIETGDDAIVLKSTQTFNESRPCENVTVTNCILQSTSTALKLGTESFSDFRYINFSDCVVRNSNRGLSIVVRDGASVEHVSFTDILVECNRKPFFWWGNGDPIWLVVKKRFPDSKPGSIRHVSFTNITATGQGTSKIESLEKGQIQDIKFTNVSLTLEAESLPDKRADNILYFDKAENIRLLNTDLRWSREKGTEKGWSHSLRIKDTDNVYIDQLFLQGNPVNSGIKPVKLEDSENIEFGKVHFPAKYL